MLDITDKVQDDGVQVVTSEIIRYVTCDAIIIVTYHQKDRKTSSLRYLERQALGNPLSSQIVPRIDYRVLAMDCRPVSIISNMKERG